MSGEADAQLQLEVYARDLRDTLSREHDANRQLKAARGQLDLFVADVRKLIDQEREGRKRLEMAYRDSLLRLARASGFRDDETGGHCDRVRYYTAILCEVLSVPAVEADRFASVAPLHDIGNIGIPDEVLRKEALLDEAEWRVMRKHPTIGASLLRDSHSELIETARLVALTHHECWDGSGYPQGLAGDAIPLCGRIVKLGDSYDALRSKRPYKLALDHDDTCRRILEGDGRTLPGHFDPTVLQAFRSTAGRFDAVFRRFVHGVA